MGLIRSGSRRRPFAGKRRAVLAGLASAAVAALALGSAYGAETSFIVGGHQASAEYPFMGSLIVSGQHHCGAALVAPALMVTAAHCVREQQASELTVRIGSNDRTSGGEVAQVARLVQGPGQADIALLVLASRVSGTPVEVAGSSPQQGEAVRLIGWGQDCPQLGCRKPPPVQLKELDTKVLSAQDCPDIKGGGQLCFASTPTDAACYGDSGGPALVRGGSGWQLVGATSGPGVSSSTTCGDSNVVYTDVTAFRDLIAAHTSDVGGGSPPSGGHPPGGPGGGPGGPGGPGGGPGGPGMPGGGPGGPGGPGGGPGGPGMPGGGPGGPGGPGGGPGGPGGPGGGPGGPGGGPGGPGMPGGGPGGPGG